MLADKPIRGESLPSETPEWQPLLDMAPHHIDDFMWMFEVELEDEPTSTPISTTGPGAICTSALSAVLMSTARTASTKRWPHAGSSIWMYYDESPHPRRPHFHASYGESEASFDIESLELIGAHKVHVRSEEGLAAEVDLSYLLDYGGVFAPLADCDYFRTLRADRGAGTIVWPNEADIAPETLYAHARQSANAGT